jgi:3-deoxy-D-manno-octulosonic-acid transferase
MSIPVIVANARMSAKSANGYQRVACLSHAMMRNIQVATQYQQDADHYLALGLPPEQLQVTGSIKFDIELAPSLELAANEFKSQLFTTVNKGPQRLSNANQRRHQEESLSAGFVDVKRRTGKKEIYVIF